MKYLASAIFAIAVCGTSSAWAVQPCDSTPNPCYTNVDDILGGKRHLLRDDDLFFLTSSNGAFQNQVLLTKNQQPQSPVASPVVTTSCGIAPNTRSGRFFNAAHDVIITLAAATSQCTATQNVAWYVTDRVTPANSSVTPFKALGASFQTVIADFNKDGLDDVILLNDQWAVIHSAADRADPSKGLKEMARIALGSKYTPIGLPVTGDFNGDGAVEVAWPGSLGDEQEMYAYFLSVCPTAGFSILGQSCSNPFQILLSNQTIDVGFYIPPSAGPPAILTAGSFKGIANQSELVVDRIWSSTEHRLLAYEFDTSLTPTQRSTLSLSTSTGPEGTGGGVGYLAVGYLDWTSQKQQLVFTNWGASSISVITFDDSLQMTPHTGALNIPNCHLPVGVSVGRYDPPNFPDGSKNFSLQIAVLSIGCSPTQAETAITLYTTSAPNDFTPVAGSPQVLGNYWPYGVQADSYNTLDPEMNLLLQGDIQGRSVVLGDPTKVTITTHLQPDLVLAIPPMHIDYIRDVDNLGPQGKPSVLNLTVMPSVPAPGVAFSTEYAFGSTASTSASSTSTSSYSYSYGGSSEQKVTFGNPKASFVSVDLKESGKSSYDNSVSKNDTNYQSVTNSLSETTGFADHLFYTQSRLNIYYYPVLGQYICPGDTPDCSDSQKQPVYVQYSGPDLIEKNDIDATTQEWYQPVHEIGNVFSYPWSLSLLQQEKPNLVALTTDPAPWRSTDTSMSSYNTTWKGGGSSSKTTGSTTSHSFDFSISVTGQIKGVFTTGMVSGEFDYSKSSSTSAMNTATTSVDASTGIQVNKPQFSDKVANTYNYGFAGYVLGINPPNEFDSKTINDSNGKPADIQAAGPLTVAFLADPLRGGAPWWQQAYNKPDVALNHPRRWSWSTSQQLASFNARDHNAPAEDDPFYQMKGLFITDPSGQGPQKAVATAGETVRLSARVYNFSLADMPANAKVHARFYGQVFKNASLFGKAFLIGENETGPIPGFNSNSTQGMGPNWDYVNVTFDTTKFADTYLVFWVVVWMDDGTNLIAELEGHGLTSTPANQTFSQITDVPIELYSNNVGLYGTYSPFYVAPPLSRQATRTGAPLGAESISVKVSGPAKVGSRMKVTVTARNNGNADLSGVPVMFFNGDPTAGGKLFDVQRIWHLRQQSSTSLRTFFTPEQAGQHNIYVQVGRAEAQPAYVSAVAKVSN